MAVWRVWFAFEERPGVMRGSRADMRTCWAALVETCRRPDGAVDVDDYTRWLDVILDHRHLLGEA